jgi:TRAP-type C4-dicarboxylate transport system substrate-binding protein
MKSLRTTVVVALVVLLLVTAALLAQRPLILGSIAPASSLWDKALKEMAADIQEVTNRRVRFRVRSGTQGDEATIIRLMKLNGTQAALLTQPALGEIDPAFNVLGMPFFFESDAEARHVLAVLRPTFEKSLSAQGFRLVSWGHTGWAHVFTADPVNTLDDLKRAKIFTSAGDDAMVQWYKRNGFNPVPLAVTDVAMALQTGQIDAYPLPPYAVMLVQYYKSAPNMLDVPLVPVINALLVTTKAWDALSVEDQRVFQSRGEQFEEQLWRDVPRQDQEAVKEMKTRGLTVSTPDPAALAEFRQAADELTASMRQSMVPPAVYDLAVTERNNFRAQ